MFDREPTRPSFAVRAVKALGLVLFVLVGGTLLFFFLHPEGVEDRIQEAGKALQAGSPREAARLLDQAERALVPRSAPGLLERIYALRSKAHLEVGNLDLAQKDLQALLKVCRDPGQKARCRLELAEQVHLGRAARFSREGNLDEAEKEIQRAVSLLETPEGGAWPGELEKKAREALGKASQRAYQLILRRIQERLALLAPSKTLLEANPLLLKLLFRREGDPRTRVLDSRMEKILAGAEVPPADRNWVRRKIRQARDWVRKAFECYGSALDLKGTFAAFQGVTGLLDLAGRRDEAAMACRIALEKSGPLYRARAACRLAGIQREAGRWKTALKTLLAWFQKDPPQSVWKRWHAIPSPVEDAWILLLDLLAFHEQKADMGRVMAKVTALWKHFPPRFQRLFGFYSGMNGYYSGWDPKGFCRDLEGFARANGERPAEWIDRYRLAQETLIHTALKQRDRKKAFIYLRRWVDQRPWDVTPRLERGALLEEDGKIEEALLDYKQAYALEPRDSILHRIWAARKKFLDSRGYTVEEVARNLLAKGNPAAKELVHPHLHLELASFFLEKGMAEPALFHAREARFVYPHSLEVKLLLEKARIAAGLLEEARVSLETTRETHPGDPRVLSLLEEVYTKEGKKDPSLDMALVLHGNDKRAFLLLARGLLRVERRDQALEAARKGLVKFGSKDPDLNLLAGEALEGMGRFPEASAYYAAVPPGGPGYWDARFRLLRTRLAMKDSKGIEASLGDFLSRGAPPERTFQAARLLYESNRISSALRLVRSLAESDRALAALGKGKVFLLLALSLYKSGHPEEAAVEAERALAFPDGAKACLFLVPYYLSRGRTRDAAEILGLQEGRFPPLDEATLLALTGSLKKARNKAQAFFLDPPRDLWARARVRALAFFLGEGKNSSVSTGDPELDDLCARWCRPLLECLYFLDQEDFRGEALKALEGLPPKEKETPWGRVILDRARLAAGLRDDALRDLVSLIAANPRMDEPWKILMDWVQKAERGRDLFFQTDLYLKSLFPLWQIRVAAKGLEDLGFLSKVVHIFSKWLRNLAEGARKIGDRAAEKRFLSLSRFFLRAQQVILARMGDKAPLETAKELLAGGDKRGAAEILEKALDSATGRRRMVLIDSFFRICMGEPSLKETGRRVARRLVEEKGGPSGPAVHFLIATEGIPLRAAVRRYLPLLRKHLERAATLPVETPEYIWAGSSARLIALLHPLEAKKAARALLLRNPSTWEAWEALGVACEGLGEWKEAREAFSVGDRYMDRSPLLAREVEFLARNDLPGLPGPEKAGGLSPSSPLGRKALALWRLRRSEYKKALDLLEKTGEENAETLFFRARAALFLPPASWKTAERNLDSLVRHYPECPYSRHAGLVLGLLRQALGTGKKAAALPASPPGSGK